MIAVKISMKATHEPLKRTPVVLRLDADGTETAPVLTDRAGVASFDLPPTSGKILVSGVERYDGRLDGEIPIELWSITQSEQDSRGLPGEFPTGSNAYPNMTTRAVQVGGRAILTDSEGYLVDPSDWSEDFARALARQEGLALNAEHWEVIRFLRARFARQGTQATVRDMIPHFRQVWGRERGSNRYLHQIFPRGGPQKQGNRLAGLLRTKGEH
ncbi:TusE/DsrC/DsvC family sulfur relay protein [Thiocystis violacea]|uniref:TusE/DsrC/DsvC family sulfur relay protein n=1 Tax=Thiocystis violacea TaxID=13725 RepID=UPI00190885C5|nr:TusE/DsrC/DsvC family sulfur relay protein [Thiocystis violacea]MBK1716195.1 sulfurtransferase TusE [Thiocystis violacea]